MPPQTNDFQELITLLTQIIGKDKATPSAMLTDTVLGIPREVDICARGEISGHEVLVGIECRAWKKKQTVEWVEAMYGKHSHLPTSKLVLVSSSGFSAGAERLAEFLGIRAITPSEVTPGFVGEIVNNLDSLWIERLDFVAERIVIYFDPPLPSGSDNVEARQDNWGRLAVYRADSTELCNVGNLVGLSVNGVDLSQVDLRDVEGENDFSLDQPSPISVNGEPVFLLGGDDPDPPTTLRRIVRFEIAGKVVGTGAKMPLTHGHYDGTNYSSGAAEIGDQKFHWAITEGEDGPRAAVRIIPTSGGLAGALTFESGEGTRMIRVEREN